MMAMMAMISMAQPGISSQRLGWIPFRFETYAHAVGQRLKGPGKERISATGTLERFSGNDSATGPVRIVWEYPLKIRLDRGGKVLVVNRKIPRTAASIDQTAIDTVQTLLEDSVEGLLAIGNDIGVTRNMGSGYRLVNAAPDNPSMDIVHMAYADLFHGGQMVEKAYWFNSQTKLLGVVSYKSPSGTRVHVVVDDWRDIEGDKVPFLIERYEDNRLILRVTLNSATVTAGVEDGAFGGN